MATNFKTWGDIPDTIAKISRVFLYNRAGIGKSQVTLLPRTIENMYNELLVILKKEKLKPPYLLVSHSMGTYLSRYFSLKRPKDVMGYC